MNDRIKRNLQKLRLVRNAAIGICAFAGWEISRGRLGKDLWSVLTRRPHDITWSDLLAECAAKAPNQVFLRYNAEAFSYRQMDQNANRTARLLLTAGGAKGRGVGIYMRNSPRFLDIFFAAQKAGMYAVTINPELRGEGLAYIINHSDIELLAVDAELLDAFDAVRQQLDRVTPEKVIVDDIEAEAAGYAIPQNMQVLSGAAGRPGQSPEIGYNPGDMCLIIYTSGTTGPPKGVVYRRNTTGVNQLRLLGHFLLRKDDVYYTYLSLSHGNALFVSTTTAMAARCTVTLSRKFSASRFWDNVRFYDATVFNTIGSIIPILMKQPEKSDDRHNNVRIVFSAACPADMWKAFEQRFGVTIYEGYGAIDGGGRGIMNLGTAPRGSLGKPPAAGRVKLVDENGAEVPAEMPGELIFKVGKGSGKVEYYKNEAASESKIRDGWLYTGDVLKRDKKGFFYFVGRNTESMRKGGENVSAWEVEQAIMKHPAVEEVAVYAVPSDLAEDEIMAAIKLVDGRRLEAAELRRFLSDKLARYAIPRYIRFADELPKTNTHRVIKNVLEKQGVTPDTDDAMEHQNQVRFKTSTYGGGPGKV